jgi:hypothetical protein
VELPLAAIVAGWLLALGWRERHPDTPRRFAFNLRQLLLVAWSVAALVVLIASIREGLLGRPDMQITGNGSDAFHLRWYQDRVAATLPRAWILSVPVAFYRLAMLAWALWLARALLRWLRWGWSALNRGGLWQRKLPRTPRPTEPAPAPSEPVPALADPPPTPETLP